MRTGAADSGGNGEDGEDSEEDIILQGWLSRQTKHAWKKEWTVVKYKYLYCYNNPEVTTYLPTTFKFELAHLLPYSSPLGKVAQRSDTTRALFCR